MIAIPLSMLLQDRQVERMRRVKEMLNHCFQSPTSDTGSLSKSPAIRRQWLLIGASWSRNIR